MNRGLLHTVLILASSITLISGTWSLVKCGGSEQIVVKGDTRVDLPDPPLPKQKNGGYAMQLHCEWDIYAPLGYFWIVFHSVDTQRRRDRPYFSYHSKKDKCIEFSFAQGAVCQQNDYVELQHTRREMAEENRTFCGRSADGNVAVKPELVKFDRAKLVFNSHKHDPANTGHCGIEYHHFDFRFFGFNATVYGCPLLGVDNGAFVVSHGFASIRCKAPYVPDPYAPIGYYCNRDPESLALKPRCIVKDWCNAFKIYLGKASGDKLSYTVGETVTVTCLDGYELYGESNITCRNGSWVANGTIPSCVPRSGFYKHDSVHSKIPGQTSQIFSRSTGAPETSTRSTNPAKAGVKISHLTSPGPWIVAVSVCVCFVVVFAIMFLARSLLRRRKSEEPSPILFTNENSSTADESM